MKKIVGSPDNFRLDGVVDSDGVGFSPILPAGPMIIKTSGFFATITSNNEIEAKIFDDDGKHYQSKMENKIRSSAGTIMLGAIICCIVSLVLLWQSIDWSNFQIWSEVFMTMAGVSVIVMMMPKACAVLIKRLVGDKEMINFSKYLGAKNAVENAYYDLGRAPNIDEVKNYSLHSSNCKYTGKGDTASLIPLIYAIRFLNGWLYWVVAILVAVIICILSCKNLLTCWQWLVVSKPDEEHYRVAIKAMEKTAQIIDSVHISYKERKIVFDPENFDPEKCEGCPGYDFCKKQKTEGDQ